MFDRAYIWIFCCLVACASSEPRQSPECPAGFVPGPLGGHCVKDCSLVSACTSDRDCPDGFCINVDGCQTCAAHHPECNAETNVFDRSCRSQEDCCNQTACNTGFEAFCGACQRSTDECSEQQPCADGKRCFEVPPPPCSCDGQPSHVCREPCDQVGCASGEVCSDTGQCRPQLCTEGFACAAVLRCAPGEGDAHECATISCVHDRDCPTGGVCVNQACSASIGSCNSIAF